MSAIAGIVGFRTDSAEAEPAERMAAALAFRGPDDEGSFRSPEGRAALAVRRLASVDSSDAASQPAPNATLDAWLALDGEIVNHRLLRHSLELAGHRFQSGSDAEVAVHAYERWGLEFLEHLAGAFALALWDDRRDRLVLARDRLGRKPLFYAERGDRLGFASAVGPLLDEMGLPRLIDPAALAEFLAQGWVAPPRTLAAGVSALAPGEMLVVERGGGAPSRSVWGRPLQDERRALSVRGLSSVRHAGNLRTLFECAVADRLAAAGPVGAVIGAGLEGGAVAAAMTRLGGAPAEAVAVLAEPDGAEAAALRAAAATARFRLAEIPVTGEQAAEAAEQIAATLAVPVAGSPVLAAWFAARAASEAGWVAALGGEGLEESMLCHPAYIAARRAAGPRWLPIGPAEALAGLSRARSREAVPAGLVPLPGWRRLLGPAAGKECPPPSQAAIPGWMERDAVGWMGYRDLTGRVAEGTCLATDCAFLAHGIEARLPFLDEQFVGYALSVPGRVRAPADRPGSLVERMFGRPKPGGGVSLPVGAWLRGALGTAVESTIRRSPLFAGGLLARSEALALLGAHRAGEAEHTEGLWALLVLCRWCEALGLESVGPPERDPAPLVQSQS